MSKRFCSYCGTELTDNAKFCFNCGSKVSSGNLKSNEKDYESENEDSISKNLYNQYKDIICAEVVTAYTNNMSVGLTLLYQKGKNYNFSKEMVDEIIYEQNKKIDNFIKYISTLYINGSLLMLDINDEEINECIQYATNIGLYEDDAQCLYDYFIEVNMIDEKGEILKHQLSSYKQKGIIDKLENIKNNHPNINNYDFYTRFIKALADLEELQLSLHNQNNSIELGKDDEKIIAEKAFEIGFSNWDDIYSCIDGAEEKLGFADKVRFRNLKIRVDKNEKMFSSICPSKEITIFGEQVKFESSLFIKGFIINSVIATADAIAPNLEKLEKIADKLGSQSSYTEIGDCCKAIAELRENSTRTVIQKLPLPKEDKIRMKESADREFEKFDERFPKILAALAVCLKALDDGVEDVRLQNELNKSMRGKWVGGGFGLKGAVKGAVTSSALNAGTGLIYSAFNGISNLLAKSGATSKKKEVFGEFIIETSKYIQDLIEEVVVFCIDYINSNYELGSSLYNVTYALNSESYRDQFKKADFKVDTLIHILKSDPYEIKNYETLASLISKESANESKTDMKALITIAEWFGIDEENLKSDFIESMLKHYENDYEIKCEIVYRSEIAFGEKNEDLRTKVFDDYLNSDTSTTLNNYTFGELRETITNIENFEQKYEYSVKQYKHKIICDFVNWHIEKDLAKFSIENLNVLFENINNVKKYYGCSDIADEAEKRIYLKIIEYCKIDPETNDPKAIDEYIKKIKEIDNKCIYDFSNLIDEFERKQSTVISELERKQRTVDGVEYDSKEEADNARNVMQIIDNIMNNNEIPTLSEKVYRIMQYKFKSEAAKQKIDELEKTLIKQINVDKNNLNYQTTVGKLILYIILTPVIGVVGCLFGWIGIVIALCVIVGMWSSYGDASSCAKLHNQGIAMRKLNIDNFYRLFVIEDDHLVPRK